MSPARCWTHPRDDHREPRPARQRTTRKRRRRPTTHRDPRSVLAGVEAHAPGSWRAETLPPPEDLTGHPQLLLRVRSVELEELTLDALVSPAVLTSGWPSCFAEFLPVVPRLTDPAAHRIGGPGFDVVILSLPGYGFSGRPARTGVTSRYTAGLWHRLMRGLGYRRYGAPDASRTGAARRARGRFRAPRADRLRVGPRALRRVPAPLAEASHRCPQAGPELRPRCVPAGRVLVAAGAPGSGSGCAGRPSA